MRLVASGLVGGAVVSGLLWGAGCATSDDSGAGDDAHDAATKDAIADVRADRGVVDGGGLRPDVATLPGTDDAGPDAEPTPDATVDPGTDASDAAPDAGPIDAAPEAAVGCATPCGPQSVCVVSTCTPSRRVFVTSASFKADLGGVGGADAQCLLAASTAHLDGDWKAWISDGTGSPSTRFAKALVPYRLLDGTTIASSWSTLVTGTLQHGVALDENGIPLSGLEIWTATGTGGSASGGSCTNFTSAASSAPYASVGISGEIGSRWTSAYPQFCDRQNHLYCFEQ